MLHFVFTVFSLSNHGQKIMVQNHLQELALVIGRMGLKLVIFMLVRISIALTIKLENIVRLLKISGKVWIATKKDEEEYKARMIIMIGIAKFLLLQALAFRGQDESSSSNNRGNFLEMLKWYKGKDKEAENFS
jgi:hypothetical protein